MAHTPGPWICRTMQGREAIASPHLYEIEGLSADVLSDAAAANARLIAAAPELLAALKLFRANIDDTTLDMAGFANAIALMHAAIAKAEGK